MTTTCATGTPTTPTALGRRWPHLLQLLKLLGRQDLLDLSLHLDLQGRQLLLLVARQVKLLLCARGEEVKPAASTRAAGTTTPPLTDGRAFTR